MTERPRRSEQPCGQRPRSAGYILDRLRSDPVSVASPGAAPALTTVQDLQLFADRRPKPAQSVERCG